MECPNCAKPINDNAISCDNCNYEIQIKCPFCAEYIKAEAVKCKHCQSNLQGTTQSSQISSPPTSPRDIQISYEKKKVVVSCNRDELFCAIVEATQHLDKIIITEADALNGYIVIERKYDILKLRDTMILTLNIIADSNNTSHIAANIRAKSALVSMNAMKKEEFRSILDKAVDLLKNSQLTDTSTISTTAGDTQTIKTKPYMMSHTQPKMQTKVVQRGEGCFLKTLNFGCGVIFLIIGIVILFLYILFNK